MSSERKGIILAGGTGSRLFPLTMALSKQLLPVYDKPMIYYPLSTLMLSNIRNILIITTPHDQELFKRLLGDGKEWGISISYEIQPSPDGLAQAFIIGQKFIGDSKCALILGDNLFYGENLINKLESASSSENSTLFAYQVNDPERYGVVSFDKYKNVIDIQEKPLSPKSDYAITGLYYYENSVIEVAKSLKPSKRGELEITDINNYYLKEKRLKVEVLGRGMAWLDTGTFDSLQEAGSFIKTLEHRQGLKVGSPEEISWRKKWIDNAQLEKLASNQIKSNYGDFLFKLLQKQ